MFSSIRSVSGLFWQGIVRLWKGYCKMYMFEIKITLKQCSDRCNKQRRGRLCCVLHREVWQKHVFGYARPYSGQDLLGLPKKARAPACLQHWRPSRPNEVQTGRQSSIDSAQWALDWDLAPNKYVDDDDLGTVNTAITNNKLYSLV